MSKTMRMCLRCGKEFVAHDGRKKICKTCGDPTPAKRCVVCGEELKSRRSRFCSSACYRKYYRKDRNNPVEARCVICNSVFLKKQSSHIYCSAACYYRARSKSRRRSRNEISSRLWPKNKIATLIPCNMCGNIFRSWDPAKNRRCPACHQKVERLFSGADVRFLEEAID